MKKLVSLELCLWVRMNVLDGMAGKGASGFMMAEHEVLL